jgi:hypothetical protein
LLMAVIYQENTSVCICLNLDDVATGEISEKWTLSSCCTHPGFHNITQLRPLGKYQGTSILWGSALSTWGYFKKVAGTYHRKQSGKDFDLFRSSRRMMDPIKLESSLSKHRRHSELNILLRETIMRTCSKD